MQDEANEKLIFYENIQMILVDVVDLMTVCKTGKVRSIICKIVRNI